MASNAEKFAYCARGDDWKLGRLFHSSKAEGYVQQRKLQYVLQTVLDLFASCSLGGGMIFR